VGAGDGKGATMSTVTVNFLEAFAQAWNRHDTDAIIGMMTPDCVLRFSAGATKEGSRFDGRDAVRAAIENLFERMPDARWEGARHFISGDRGVTEWTMVATPRDGRPINADGCDVFHFRDGRISFKDSYRKFPA
jgi:ketosteroid isomerase-like protein